MPDVETSKVAQPEPRIGSYRLIRQLGSGGMSSVFRAVHAETGHEVAVKVLPRYLAKNPTLLQRFLREAKSAEALEHPNIVAIYDRGHEDGRYYLVLEYVDGGDFHDHVRQNGPMPIPDAVRVIREAALGLQYAAGLGIVHRDVKPANLLRSRSGQVKIADLGLALRVEAEDERVTRDGTTVGTVDYMAPEQARDSRATSVRSDIYSLGCTFYFLLTGTPPFPGGDVTDKLRRHAIAPPPDPRKARPEVPAALADLIRRMLAKSPEGRFADYDRLIEALDALPIAGPGEDDLPQLVPLDDEDRLTGFVLGTGRSGSGLSPAQSTTEFPPRAPSRGSGSGLKKASLGDLARSADSVAPEARARPQTVEPLLRQILEEETEPGLPPPAFGNYRERDESMAPYILRGVLIGGAIGLVLLGAHFVASILREPPAASAGPGKDATEDVDPELTPEATPVPPRETGLAVGLDQERS